MEKEWLLLWESVRGVYSIGEVDGRISMRDIGGSIYRILLEYPGCCISITYDFSNCNYSYSQTGVFVDINVLSQAIRGYVYNLVRWYRVNMSGVSYISVLVAGGVARIFPQRRGILSRLVGSCRNVGG